jgi:hypothetical protein
MHRIEGEVEEEGLRRVLGWWFFVLGSLTALNETHRLIRELVGEILRRLNRLAVANDRIVVRLARQIGPRPAEEAEVIIEPALMRSQTFFEADVPFADHARGIACGLQLLRQRRNLARQAEVVRGILFRPRVRFKAEAMLIHPAHQPRPRRRAHAMRRVAIREAHTILRDAVDVRRRDVLAAVHADVRIAEVIGEEDDDVGTLRSEYRGQQDEGSEEGDESRFHSEVFGSVLFPQRRQLRLGDKAILVRIEPVEERGGEFVAAEFAVLVGVALLEGTACTNSAGLPGVPVMGIAGAGRPQASFARARKAG